DPLQGRCGGALSEPLKFCGLETGAHHAKTVADAGADLTVETTVSHRPKPVLRDPALGSGTSLFAGNNELSLVLAAERQGLRQLRPVAALPPSRFRSIPRLGTNPRHLDSLVRSSAGLQAQTAAPLPIGRDPVIRNETALHPQPGENFNPFVASTFGIPYCCSNRW